MGILDKNVGKLHQRQKQSLLQEAAKAGLQVLAVHDVGDPRAGAGQAVSSTLKALFGGKLATDNIQIFELGWGQMRLLYIQPYAGMTVLPGEHHACLHGSFRTPIALTDTAIFGGPTWDAGPDQQLAQWLNKQNPALKAVTKKCEFDWAIGMSKITLEWAVQLYSLGNGASHLVMQPGRYGGITTYEVGFQQFANLVHQLAPLMPQAAEGLEGPRFPLAFLFLFERFLLGMHGEQPLGARPAEGAAAPTAVSAQTADRGARVRELAGRFESKKIHVANLPEKKERNVRKVVLPPAAQGAPLAAVFDLTTFGSAKDAVVFTETHLYAHETDDRASFALQDLMKVHGFEGMLEGKIAVEVEGIGKLIVPCGTQGDALLAVLKGLAP